MIDETLNDENFKKEKRKTLDSFVDAIETIDRSIVIYQRGSGNTFVRARTIRTVEFDLLGIQ